MTPMRFSALCAAIVLAATLAVPVATGAEVTVFNYEVLGDAYREVEPAPLKTITIVGARNGTFSGAVALKSAEKIVGVKASTAELVGDGAKIPLDQTVLQYAISWNSVGGGPGGLDILLKEPPAEVEPLKNQPALVGVWITVKVPEDAKPGLYRGQLTVEAEGLPAKTIPVELTVADWRLPDPKQQRTWIEMIQSPDTLALEYDVPLWSDRHWELIGQSFQLIRPTGSRIVYIPLLRNTNQGNSESMVRWIKQKDGSYKADYTIMEKYLDVAQEHLDKDLDLVVFYAWDAYMVLKHRKTSFEERPKEPGQAQQRWDMRQQGLTVTMLNEETGETEPGGLPLYTDPKSKEIWAPVYKELRERMKRRGLEDAMVLGMVNDLEPSREEIEFLNEVSGLSWVCHAHYQRTHGKPSPNNILSGVGDIRYEAHAYSLIYQVNIQPDRLQGWQVPEDRVYLDRFGLMNGKALRIRLMPQMNITGNQRGVGRIGADFWSVIRDPRGRRVGQAFVRYPENHWRGLNISNYLLAPGPNGPVGTARLANLREGVQESEARIFIQDALLDEEKKAKLGDDLAKRAQTILDEHQRAMWLSYWTDNDQLEKLGVISGRSMYEALWGGLSKTGVDMPGFWDGSARRMRSDADNKGHDWFVDSGWQERTKRLFVIASEVEAKLK